MDQIPIIDLSTILQPEAPDSAWETLSKSVYNALSDVGFLYLAGHGIPKEKIQNAFKASKAFFDLPSGLKLKYKKKIYSGYLPADEIFHPTRIHELRELYDYCGPTLWPNMECPELQIAMSQLQEENNKLASIIFRLLAKSLGLPNETFYEHHLGLYSNNIPSQYTHRALHYPRVPSKYGEFPGAIRCCEHTDYGTVTLLFQDEIGGLEIQTVNKDWIPAKYIPDTILINTNYGRVDNFQLPRTVSEFLTMKQNVTTRVTALPVLFILTWPPM